VQAACLIDGWDNDPVNRNDRDPPDNESILWIGAGTKDTGLSLTRRSFQITHATDSDTNAERDSEGAFAKRSLGPDWLPASEPRRAIGSRRLRFGASPNSGRS
jgi:hypothetical protein